MTEPDFDRVQAAYLSYQDAVRDRLPDEIVTYRYHYWQALSMAWEGRHASPIDHAPVTGPWALWWAWRPVRLRGTGEWAWFRTVDRRRVIIKLTAKDLRGFRAEWQYRGVYPVLPLYT